MIDAEVAALTDRVIARPAAPRAAYLHLIDRAREAGVDRPRLACGNLHVSAPFLRDGASNAEHGGSAMLAAMARDFAA